MSTSTLPTLTAHGLNLDTSDEAFGFLRSSEHLLHDPEALRTRLQDDGYLFIRNFLPQDIVQTARLSILQRLSAAGHLDPNAPLEAGVTNKDDAPKFMPSLANPNRDVERVVFGPELLGFYQRLFGGPIRHFDYIWARSLGRG
ncbi:MAG: hypothetical protein KDK74_09895, partial [Cephaloticoccus sp.]|nr:hypothetical protein [Cephaloticoccus sp.]